MALDALGLGLAFVLVFGLLVVACLILTAILLVLGGIAVHPPGTVVGLALSVVVGGGAHLLAGVAALSLVVGFGGLLLGIAIGRRRWPDARPPEFVHRTTYRLVVLTVGIAGIGTGLGVWIVLVGTAGPTLARELFLAHPDEALALLLVTGPPIVGGVVAVRRFARAPET